MKTGLADRLPLPTVLEGVRYRDYVRLRNEPGNSQLRMTYHNGILEIMSPEYAHEVSSRRIGLLLFILTGELAISCQGTQSTTFRRGMRNFRKGLGKEPNQSFYLANLDRILGNDAIDLDRDPPPDLWIEVDHRASSGGRLPLYAGLGIPEVWRYQIHEGILWFGRLVDGSYQTIDRSHVLPMLTPSHVLEALAMGEGISESLWGRRLRLWVRETFGSTDVGESPTH